MPFAARGQIHRAKLPLPQWVLDARFKATLLLLVADLQPETLSISRPIVRRALTWCSVAVLWQRRWAGDYTYRKAGLMSPTLR